MNTTIKNTYSEYLTHTDGDKATAAILTLASVLASKAEEKPQAQDDTLTVAEAAKLLKTHELTIYRLCKSGRLLAYKVGRVLRIPRDELSKLKGKALQEMPNKLPIVLKRHV